ncbi:hypothetical protein ALT785_270120 [Alteromonas infernus]
MGEYIGWLYLQAVSSLERLKKTGMFVSIAHVSAPSILKLATKYESYLTRQACLRYFGLGSPIISLGR